MDPDNETAEAIWRKHSVVEAKIKKKASVFDFFLLFFWIFREVAEAWLGLQPFALIDLHSLSCHTFVQFGSLQDISLIPFAIIPHQKTPEREYLYNNFSCASCFVKGVRPRTACTQDCSFATRPKLSGMEIRPVRFRESLPLRGHYCCPKSQRTTPRLVCRFGRALR